MKDFSGELDKKMDQTPDRKDELIEKLKNFDSEHDFWLKRIRLMIGRLVMRVGGNPISRWMIANVTTQILAFLIVRFKALGIEKGKDEQKYFEPAAFWGQASSQMSEQ